MTRKLTDWLLPLWFPASILLGWQAATSHGILDPLFFPPPTTLAATISEMGHSGDLAQHLGATLTRAALGFLLGTLAGIVVGAAMGASRTVCRSLESVISSIYTLPKLTLLPMLMLLVGIGDTARYLVIAATAFILVTIHTLDGVHGVRRHYIEMACNYGANYMAVFRRVYLPERPSNLYRYPACRRPLSCSHALGRNDQCQRGTRVAGLELLADFRD